MGLKTMGKIDCSYKNTARILCILYCELKLKQQDNGCEHPSLYPD